MTEKVVLWTLPGEIEVPEKVVNNFMHWIEEEVVEDLMERYWPQAGPIKVTEEDIRRYYAFHPDMVEEALVETAHLHKLGMDHIYLDMLECWFQGKFSPRTIPVVNINKTPKAKVDPNSSKAHHQRRMAGKLKKGEF